ncbi:MAG: hypothetical protein FWE68_03470 [Defluviitaleaceae bacterium]|nr:hypothetical protein [Defluviitaleaceae bacterium]
MLIIIIVAVVLIIIIAAVANSIPKGPSNAMAAMYDGFKNLLTSEGFDISGYYQIGDIQGQKFSASVLFGEDVVNSVYDYSYAYSYAYNGLSSGDDYSGWQRSFYTGNNLVTGANNLWGGGGLPYLLGSDYIAPEYEINDPRAYHCVPMYGGAYAPEGQLKREISQEFRYLEEEIYDYLGVPIKLNSLVSNHRIDWGRAVRDGNAVLAALSGDYEMRYILSELGIDKIPEIDEIRRVFERFLYVKCEERGFVDRFLSNHRVSGNTYSFTVTYKSLLELIYAFEDYLNELEEQQAVLSRIGVKESTVRDMRRAYRIVVLQYTRDFEYAISSGEGDMSIDITIQLDKNRALKKMTGEAIYSDYGYEEYKIEGAINVTKVNGSNIDIKALDRFAEEAEALFIEEESRLSESFGQRNEP